MSLPTLAQLAPVSRLLRLAPPTRVTLLAPPWSHATFRVELAGPPRDSLPSGRPAAVLEYLLRRPIGWTGRDTLEHERAALTLLQGVPELPVVRTYEVLPAGLLPWPAAVSAVLPGTPADRVIGAHPDRAEAIAEALGRLMAIVAHRTASSTFGTGVRAGRFVPLRSTWREEVTARVEEGIAATRAAATSLGPLSTELEARLRDGLATLATATTFSLVHGDPSPGNLLVADTVEQPPGATLSGWIDWEGAVLGDPLLEWAALLAQPPAILAAAVRGYGREQVRALLDADGRACLEVYALWGGLSRTTFAAAPLFDGDGWPRRAAVLARARDVVAEVLAQPRAAETRMEAALAAGVGGRWTPWRPDPVALVRRRALLRLASVPELPAASAQPLADALASLELADHASGEVRAGWLAQADQLVGALPAAAHPAPVEPIPDRAAWRQRVATDAWRRGPRTLALTVLHLGTAAVDRLGGTVDDGVLRGLEALVRALAILEGGADGEQRLPVSLRLTHAARGLAAAKALAVHEDELSRHLHEAWDIASGGTRSSQDRTLDDLLAAGARAPARPGHASLLDALRTVPPDQLPDAPAALLALALR